MGLALALLAAALILRWQAAPPATIAASIDLQSALSDAAGSFATVVPGRPFSFPADHGEHPEFKTEWWYFTGNLSDQAGLAYGYQLTFFRTGLATPAGKVAQGPWTPDAVMMAHFAVSDPEGGKFHPFQRFSRPSLGLAGVKSNSAGLSVWLEQWRMERSADGHWKLLATETTPDGQPLSLELTLEEQKPPVLQGQQGYSRKGPDPAQASYYVSLTRLASAGELSFGNRRLAVRGLSWFDHEWSSSAMAPGLAGWDWFSLQLDDGWDLMLYLLRYQDGRVEPASSGSLVSPDGTKTHLSLADFRVSVESHHTSAEGVRYPSSWTVELPASATELKLTPRLADQEMTGSVKYWEGAVTAKGQRAGKAVRGSGFVEMTGYR